MDDFIGIRNIPSASGYWSSNALWVFDDNMWGPRPETQEVYVAWPPPGYVPYHFSYDDADFSSASVSMSSGGSGVPVAVQPVFNGYGENTLVWEPSATFGVPPAADTAYTVHVNNVRINSVSQNFTYEVIVFDPNTRLAASGSESAQLGIPLRFPLTEPCR